MLPPKVPIELPGARYQANRLITRASALARNDPGGTILLGQQPKNNVMALERLHYRCEYLVSMLVCEESSAGEKLACVADVIEVWQWEALCVEEYRTA